MKRRGDYGDNDPKRYRQEHRDPPYPPPHEKHHPQQSNYPTIPQDRTVSLLSNYFKMELKGNPPVFQYKLTITPSLESRRIIGGVLKNLESVIGDFIVGSHEQLFLFKDLKECSMVVVSKPRNGGEEKSYEVCIEPKGVVLDQLGLFYCLNLLFKKLMRAKRLEPLGRAYFDPTKSIRISGRRESFNLWPGYKTALERIAAGLFVNAELKHKVVRNETVWDVIRKFRGDVDAELQDRIVITRYNNKTYRISAIKNTTVRKQTFTDKKSGKVISVLEYMRQTYPQEMKGIDEEQPLITCTPARLSTGYKGQEIYLIPQLCLLTGLTDEMRQDSEMMKTFKKHTLIEPQKRLDQLYELLRGFSDPKLKEQAQLRSWDIQISRQPIQLNARVLAKEPFYMKNHKGEDTEVVNNDGQWIPHKQNLKFHRLTGPKEDLKIVNWAIIFPDGGVDIDGVVDTFTKVSDGAGLILTPDYRGLQRTAPDDYARELQTLQQDTHFVLCVLPKKSEDIYNRIKSVYCSANPVVSQCVTVQVLGKSLQSVCTKLVFQIVAKIGGAPWVYKHKFHRPTMIVGIDISHNKGKKSTVGIVASMDKSISKFYSRVYQNSGDDQRIPQLGAFIKDACISFNSLNTSNQIAINPKTIIIFRDGVGESQMGPVIDDELKQIEETLRRGEVGCVEIIYVVVQKRIDTRFFLLQGRDRVVNVESGTVVNSTVTASPEKHQQIGTNYDFYLVGQSHKQGNSDAAGTMNPAHYWVRHKQYVDKIDNPQTPDSLQRLTYMLCHLYYNWTGTVSTPALCKYAKVLATLAGKSLGGRDLDHKLHHKLPYL